MARLKAILETIPDPVVVYDGSGIPEYVNPAFTEVFGWTNEELFSGHIPYVREDQVEVTQAKIAKSIRARKGPSGKPPLHQGGQMLGCPDQRGPDRQAGGRERPPAWWSI
jgi:PAS domain S-box-containing protein